MRKEEHCQKNNIEYFCHCLVNVMVQFRQDEVRVETEIFAAVLNKENMIGKTQVQTKQLCISINTQGDNKLNKTQVRNQLSTSRNKRQQIFVPYIQTYKYFIQHPVY